MGWKCESRRQGKPWRWTERGLARAHTAIHESQTHEITQDLIHDFKRRLEGESQVEQEPWQNVCWKASLWGIVQVALEGCEGPVCWESWMNPWVWARQHTARWAAHSHAGSEQPSGQLLALPTSWAQPYTPHSLLCQDRLSLCPDQVNQLFGTMLPLVMTIDQVQLTALSAFARASLFRHNGHFFLQKRMNPNKVLETRQDWCVQSRNWIFYKCRFIHLSKIRRPSSDTES